MTTMDAKSIETYFLDELQAGMKRQRLNIQGLAPKLTKTSRFALGKILNGTQSLKWRTALEICHETKLKPGATVDAAVARWQLELLLEQERTS